MNANKSMLTLPMNNKRGPCCISPKLSCLLRAIPIILCYMLLAIGESFAVVEDSNTCELVKGSIFIDGPNDTKAVPTWIEKLGPYVDSVMPIGIITGNIFSQNEDSGGANIPLGSVGIAQQANLDLLRLFLVMDSLGSSAYAPGATSTSIFDESQPIIDPRYLVLTMDANGNPSWVTRQVKACQVPIKQGSGGRKALAVSNFTTTPTASTLQGLTNSYIASGPDDMDIYFTIGSNGGNSYIVSLANNSSASFFSAGPNYLWIPFGYLYTSVAGDKLCLYYKTITGYEKIGCKLGPPT